MDDNSKEVTPLLAMQSTSKVVIKNEGCNALEIRWEQKYTQREKDKIKKVSPKARAAQFH